MFLTTLVLSRSVDLMFGLCQLTCAGKQSYEQVLAGNESPALRPAIDGSKSDHLFRILIT